MMPSNDNSSQNDNTFTLEYLELSIDVIWISLSTYLIFNMQLGFTFLEAGSVRLKNLNSILLKNCLNLCVNTLCWWTIGYGLAFGDDSNGFIGKSKFLLSGYVLNNVPSLHFLFQWAYAITAATIMSGCVSERMSLLGYTFYSLFSIGFVYPVIVHWTWGGGWLQQMGFQDFSGASVVHCAGGIAGLMATYSVGPRKDRFCATKIDDFRPNNIMFCVLGTVILWYSWYGFNCGQTLLNTSQHANKIPLIALNTTLSAVSGALSSIAYHAFLNRNKEQKYSTVVLCNGLIAGLVASTGGCDQYEPVYATVLGVVSGITYYWTSQLVLHLKVDDPLQVISVHGGCGLLGVLSIGIQISFNQGGYQWAIQLLGIICIISWVIVCESLFLLILKKLNFLKIIVQSKKIKLEEANCNDRSYYDYTRQKAYTLLTKINEQNYVDTTTQRQSNQLSAIQQQQIMRQSRRKKSQSLTIKQNKENQFQPEIIIDQKIEFNQN